MAKPTGTAYFDWQIEVMPRCYAGPYAERYFGTICPFVNHWGLEGDTLAARSRMIADYNGPPSVLKHIGAERMMGRVRSETVDQYRSRLLDAWRAWTFAGTPEAIIRQLDLLDYTVEVKQNSDWNWDGDTSRWARFWVVFTGHPFSQSATIEYDDGSEYDAGHLWDGLGAMSTELNDIMQIINQWKPAHTYCSGLIFVMDAGTWAVEQPDGTWGDPANRSLSAVYWDR